MEAQRKVGGGERICDKVKKIGRKMELLDVRFGENYGTTGEIVGKL